MENMTLLITFLVIITILFTFYMPLYLKRNYKRSDKKNRFQMFVENDIGYPWSLKKDRRQAYKQAVVDKTTQDGKHTR